MQLHTILLVVDYYFCRLFSNLCCRENHENQFFVATLVKRQNVSYDTRNAFTANIRTVEHEFIHLDSFLLCFNPLINRTALKIFYKVYHYCR